MDTKPFKQLMDEAKQIKLEASEKTQIKNELLLFMSKHPVFNTPNSFWPFSAIFMNLKSISLKPVAVVVILTLILGGGLSVAADSTLPGDLLYPVKLNFNEEVQGWAKFSNESEAIWYVELANRRIEEGEKLATEGRLSFDIRTQIETNFEEHANRVEDRVDKFQSKNLNNAADVVSKFEASLEAHDVILMSIGVSTSSEVQFELESLRTKINERREKIGKFRGQIKIESESGSEGKIRGAEIKTDDSEENNSGDDFEKEIEIETE